MSTLKVNTISEQTAANGVLVDGTLIKDAGLTATGLVTHGVVGNADLKEVWKPTYHATAAWDLAIYGVVGVDEIMFFGWNPGSPAAKPRVAGEPSNYLALESNWGGACEGYFEFTDEDNSIARRPYQYTVDRVTGVIQTFINGAIAIGTSAGVVGIQIADGGGISLTGAGKAFVQETNDVPVLRQKNVGGGGYYNIQLNSGDQWSIDAPITMWSDILFNHSNLHGPIILDRADGHGYRIICTNGVLGTEHAI
jgi:hypothetical protein